MSKPRQCVMVLLLLFRLNLFTHADLECPSDYTDSKESGTCLKLFSTGSTPYTWSEARDMCIMDGGDLVKIVNREMNDLVYDLSPVDWVWIGLNDRVTEETWVWLDETDEAAWTNWASGQPDKNMQDQDCVILDRQATLGQWRDIVCETTGTWRYNYFICERPDLTTTTTLATTTEVVTTTKTTSTTPVETTSAPTTSSASVTSTWPTTSSSLGGLSYGAVAGIAVGALVVAALVAAAFLAGRYSNKRRQTAQLITDHSVAYSRHVDDKDKQARVTMGQA